MAVTHIIKLNDILKIDSDTLRRTKIRLMVPDKGADVSPLVDYRKNPSIVNDDWFGWKYAKRELFRVGEIGIGLMWLGYDNWLLVTVKEIVSATGVPDSFAYVGESIEGLEKYFGRVVVHYRNEKQTMVRWASGIIDDMIVAEILSDKYEGDEFPGYESVVLSWDDLSRVVGKREWITALKNQKGVYLITDKSNGKHYVGSASGEEMLLQRWRDYANSGHGGNKELRPLGKEHSMKYFQYSILENFNRSTPDDYILKRESWWKSAMLSRIPHGYNAN
jgi:hypothetical protein